MAVGFPQSKAEIDSRVGYLSQTLRDRFVDVVNFKAFADGLTDPQLTALGYSAADITLLRAVVIDLYNLEETANGRRTQTPATDFFFNAKKVTGPN
jgi:hypothetical protein